MSFKSFLILLCFLNTSISFAFQGTLTPSTEYILSITEPSGLVYNNQTGTLFTNNDGSNSNIYEITTRGLLKNTFSLDGQDFEGITLNAANDSFYVVEEYTSHIVKYSSSGSYGSYIAVDVNVQDAINGLEGITIDPETGHIFVVKEKEDVLLIELSNSGKQLNRTILNFINNGDASGIAFHPVWKTLFILSHENKSIYETTTAGIYLRSWSIPVEKAEGITFNAALDTIYIVDDSNNTLYLFPFNEKPYIHTLYINELMAGNNSTLADENGEYDDWIELYNPNTYSVDIAGLSIADNFNRLGLWQIPKNSPAQTTIPPNGHILLWADEDTSQGPLHVDIKLNKAGEQLALYNGVFLLDSVSFSTQTDDISYGRETDGGTPWEFFNPSSPGEDNTTGQVLALSEIKPTFAQSFELYQNYPNPFNPTTKINYELRIANSVKLTLYDIAGREVVTLVKENQSPGTYTVTFNAANLPSGLYFYTLISGKMSSTRKMILLK